MFYICKHVLVIFFEIKKFEIYKQSHEICNFVV
jgi:hypothetical protein